RHHRQCEAKCVHEHCICDQITRSIKDFRWLYAAESLSKNRHVIANTTRMTKRNYNIKEYKRLGLLTIFLMLFSIGNLWADGSKDLYPSGAQGGRAYLRASTTESPAFPFPNL